MKKFFYLSNRLDFNSIETKSISFYTEIIGVYKFDRNI